MSGSESASGDIFDQKRIRRLIELMKEHDLTELDLQQGDAKVRLSRQLSRPVELAPARPRSVAAEVESAPPPAAAPPAADDSILIKSPMLGTFYATPKPGEPPFVKVGDHVGPQTTVCIIEAMKVFNEIPAEVSGQVIACLVESGAPVDFGQPLFRVKPGK